MPELPHVDAPNASPRLARVSSDGVDYCREDGD